MYYIVYGLLYLLSLLPLRVLYFISDFAYFIIYHVADYRKNVVLYNLSIAFPEKAERERKLIAKKFYRNFTDNFIETIKLISAGKNFIRKHYLSDTKLFDELYQQGKKCQVHLGHNFNWEIANLAMAFYTPYTLLSVYMPINNATIDRLFKKIRAKTGSVLLPATQMRTAILPWRDKQYLLALVADQNPGVPSKGYWVNFFGKPTPFVTGPEKGARTNDTAVIFINFTKTKRGYYEAHPELGTLEPRKLPEKELTKIYIQYLERVIRANPEMWLWSHRRWKHEWKPEYGEIIA
ncbi:MAG TPA: lysophospholipid acyltransferase family protein [Flavisolibacter sp.]|jgi:KDO2-lipid IV(A) lauroyltransferase|nr:lysophospholipid acyltransferase family protein [Flavisolibacter sp.]